MKIDLDDKWCITSDNYCNAILVKKSGGVLKNGTPAGKHLYYQSYGQAVKEWIQKAAISEDINSFQELANFIDSKLEDAKLKIDQQVSEHENS